MSSGSESDEDYVPGEPEQLSEEESANEETDQQYDKELDTKTKKRKVAQENNGKKKLKTKTGVKAISIEEKKEEEVPTEAVNPEQEKKREDDLWAMFLEGTDTKPKPKESKPTVEANKPVFHKGEPVKIEVQNDNKARERRIFEFAGETIVVENNVIKEKIKTAESPATATAQEGPSKRPAVGGGVSGILGQLNKKNKLSTLEKSKLDWLTYKKDEGIEEEIQSHNKGKNGYLDRRDFLERADVRQYEIERDLRLSRRSNR